MVRKVYGASPWARLIAHARVTDGGCWEYQGARNRKGYGRFRVGGETILAHRFALEHALGRPLAAGMLVLHRCDNPPCCNPEHLYEGDAARNSQDMVDRGRSGTGESGSQSTLAEDGVLAIFDEYRRGDALKTIAERHGTTAQNVVTLVSGRTWRHLAHLAPPLRRGKGGRRPRHAIPLTRGSDAA